ncbi:hypothetical protein [Deinococcus seoulensis]|uniref:hypothetical protein n=1 Tax=Deinococcus seoulensis TaxID=1837379 RepID=UPI001E5AEA08|nr:hypothetical protein [Deinococcus seoulensis]
MKKLALAAIGLTGILASCGATVTVTGGFTPGTGASNSLRLKDFAYSTQYRTTTAFTDQNGNTVAAGSYVICDNLNTEMYVDLTWQGGLSKLYVQFEGLNTGATKDQQFFSYGQVDYSGSGRATSTLAPNTAPLRVLTQNKLSAQAIVVNPVIVRVKGNTFVRVQGVDQNGQYSNIKESAQAFPVVDCQ